MGIESKNGFEVPQITTRPTIDVLPNEETVDRVVNKINRSLADQMREDMGRLVNQCLPRR